MSKKKSKHVKPSSPKSTFLQKPEKWVLMILAFVLYGASINYQYVLDDDLYIGSNQFTKLGIKGIPDILAQESLVGFYGEKKDLVAGGRYRPLPIVTYALEYQIFGPSPAMSHFVNILFYGLTGILLFQFFSQLFPPEQKKWYQSIPFWATVLFMAHPIHSEVVANIKGRVEMMTLMGALLSLNLSLKYLKEQKVWQLPLLVLTFFATLLCKESAITFVAIIPITWYYFRKPETKDWISLLAVLAISTFAFLFIRYQVIGFFLSSGKEVTEILNDPFYGSSIAEKYATILYTWGIYLWKLIFPFTLSHDYYPFQIPIINWVDWRAIVPTIIYLAIISYGVIGFFKKDKTTYGIWFFLAAFSIVSNFVFSIGAFMNERFVYIASVGFIFSLIYWLSVDKPFKAINQKTIINALIVVSILFAIRTWVRIPAWTDNFTLFTTDVKNSPNSTKVNTAAGGVLLESAFLPQNQAQSANFKKDAVKYLKKALEIHPTNPNALLLMGNAEIQINRDIRASLENYYKLLEANVGNPDVNTNLLAISDGGLNNAESTYLMDFIEKRVLPLGPTTHHAYSTLGKLKGQIANDLDASIRYLHKANEFGHSYIPTYQNLAAAYGFKGDFAGAIKACQSGLAIDPGNAKLMLNMGVSYQRVGEEAKGNELIRQALILDPRLNQGQ